MTRDRAILHLHSTRPSFEVYAHLSTALADVSPVAQARLPEGALTDLTGVLGCFDRTPAGLAYPKLRATRPPPLPETGIRRLGG